ncbi:tRNA lysidine(34) synthetase TilS [Agrobacterium deltaense]|uniref:tRNA lysidine(34) synthetase TilS n=1 Tax=Agrobacterium deltaense TaxID=1183412 RepID=UPI001C6F19E6|nr:tRNA lysidine(34) synthetase TilS [Agrobacterium deltaense]MBW9072253.1 tRNA lysidine(34) synthetase TilS [Agrobacterium deltaense]
MPAKTSIADETGLAPLEAAGLFVAKLRKPAHILVAISGGSDSTGLLLALHEASIGSGEQVRLSAVTIDHALRPESADEAKKVATLCAGLGIFHAVRRWDDQKPASGLAEASRLARYRLIAGVADTMSADVIVTGHTQGDQRETVEMRAARGKRADNLGLSGMADAVLYGGRHWVMRPFLHCERQAIRDYLLERAQGWIDDPSNENRKYERVRVRQALDDTPRLFPYGTSDTRSELSARAARFVHHNSWFFSLGLIRINAESLGEDPAVIRYALSALSGVIGGRRYPMASDTMDRVMALVANREPGRITANRVVFDYRKDALYLMRENRNIPSLRMPPGARMVWDERFDVFNRSDAEIVVRAFGAGDTMGILIKPSGVIPPGILKRSSQTMPVFVRENHDLEFPGSGVAAIRPLLAPYDLFLPRFDLELANVIAMRLLRAAYPQPPV